MAVVAHVSNTLKPTGAEYWCTITYFRSHRPRPELATLQGRALQQDGHACTARKAEVLIEGSPPLYHLASHQQV